MEDESMLGKKKICSHSAEKSKQVGDTLSEEK